MQGLLFKTSLSVVMLSFSVVGCGVSERGVRNIVRDEVEELRAVQAEMTADLSELRDELRVTRGQVEELEFVARGQTAKLAKTLEQFSARVPPPEGVSEELLQQDEKLVMRRGGPESVQFREGLTQIRAGDFESARLTFSNFTDLNPNTEVTDNALYWVGVSLEKLGFFDRAIVAYSEIYQKFPGEDRVPFGLYRLAQTFKAVNSPDDAKLTLQKLIDDFPRHPLAKRSRAELQKL